MCDNFNIIFGRLFKSDVAKIGKSNAQSKVKIINIIPIFKTQTALTLPRIL